MVVTPESRHAVSRARFFLDKAKGCPPDSRIDFEAFLEACIVFARAAVHRTKSKHQGHPNWNSVWSHWRQQPAIQFFRQERDWILKEAPPKLGQKIFPPSIGSSEPTAVPCSASGFYFYDDPNVPAAVTVEGHLASLEALLATAEQQLLPRGTT